MKQKAKIFEHLEAVAKIFPAPMYWFDLESRFLGINELSLEAIGGKSYDDIIGKTPYEIGYYGADKIVEHNNKVTQTGETLTQEDVISNISTGKIRTFLAVRSPLFDDDGNVVGVVGTSVEITAQKEAEELKNENKQLELQNTLNQIMLEQQEQFRRIVDKVAHDVRAPVASIIHTAKTATMLPEDDRITLRNAGNRVNDLANNLLSFYKPATKGSAATSDKRGPLLVSGAISEILSEKRAQYYGKPVKFEDKYTHAGNFAFIDINPNLFKRMLSNLINNSVDAFEGRSGAVTVGLESEADLVTIWIQDNGKGMSPELIAKIKESVVVTEGKTDGHGIGWDQVRETLQLNKGHFIIESTLNVGTKIVLTFPKIKTPSWMAEKIQLNSDDFIVILDDDPSIHGAWDSRFAADAPTLRLKHFHMADDTIKFINALPPDDKQKIFLLTDYELLQQGLHGLDVVEQTGIERSILVTSHHENKEIQQQSQKSHTRILPKLLALEVPIEIVPIEIVQVGVATTTSIPSEISLHSVDSGLRRNDGSEADNLLQVDMLIVDDNEDLMRDIRNNFFKHKKIDAYFEPHTFLANIHKYAKDTKILIDNNFDNYKGDIADIYTYNTGFCLARMLYEDGYTNLYLFTGDRIEEESLPDYLKIVAKNNLDGIEDLLSKDTEDDKQDNQDKLVQAQELHDRIVDFVSLSAYKQRDYLDNIQRATTYIKDGHAKFTRKTFNKIEKNLSAVNQILDYERETIALARKIHEGLAATANLLICDLDDSFRDGNLRLGLKSSYNAFSGFSTYGFKYMGNIIIFDMLIITLLDYIDQQRKKHANKGDIRIRMTKTGTSNKLSISYEAVDKVSKKEKHIIPFEQLPDYTSALEFCKNTMQLFGGSIGLNWAQDRYIEFILEFPKLATTKNITAA